MRAVSVGAVLGLMATLPSQEADSYTNAIANRSVIDVVRGAYTEGPLAEPPEVVRRSAGVDHLYQRRPSHYCGNLRQERTTSSAPCVDGADDGLVVRYCEDGTVALDPLFRRPVDDAGRATGPWEQVDNGGCPEDPAPDVVLTAEDFRRLPLTPALPQIQPSDGRALVVKGIAVHTDPSPQVLTTTLLGVLVQVRATPVQFTWDFGDGTVPAVTRVAGEPWPHHAALGPYEQPGDYELRLTTTWQGEFQVAGAGPWRPVTGTATTTSEPVPITVVTAPARLYADR